MLYTNLAGKQHYFINISTRLDASRYVDSYTFYDGRGAVAETFDNWTAANGWSTQDIEYDVMGRAYRASNPYYCGGYAWVPINPTGFWTTKTFDNLGRVKQVTMPTGDASPSSTTNVQSIYAGTVTTVTDQAGKQRRQITDALGRVVRLDEPDAAGSLGTPSAPTQYTAYEYDPLDNLTRINQGAQNRYFKYDSLSRLTHERQVEQDAPHYAPDPATLNNYWSRKIIYNSHSLVTDAYDARQVRTQMDYDGLNRVWHINYSGENPAVTPNVTYSYDQARTGYFNQGRLTTVSTATLGSAPQTTLEFDFDNFGRVAGHRQKIGATSYTMGYSHNYLNELVSETYPSGRVMNYVYDEGARLASVNDGATTYASGLTYAPHGGLTSETFGNSFVHTMGYNSRLQASQVKLAYGGAEQQRFDYSYGRVDQGTGTIDIAKNNGQLGRIDGFVNGVRQWDQRLSYDSLGRLSEAGEFRADNSSLTYRAHYDYDRYGNRFQYQQNINLSYTTVQPGDVDANRNRFISTEPMPTSYDPAGNILADAKFRGLSYAYDANNRQTSASGTGWNQTAVYDALGQRVQTTAGTTRQMVYDAFGQIIAEYKGGLLELENLYRGGQLLATQEFTSPTPTPENVIWMNVSSTIQVSGNSLTKVSGTSSWYDAGAVSTQTIAAGDGYVEFTPGSTTTWRMCGLGNGDTGAYFADIEYAFFMIGSADLGIYEAGVLRGYFGTYAATDRLRVAVEGGVVKYYRNGVLLYTSTVAPQYPLLVDTSLNTVWSYFSNVVIGRGQQNVVWTNVSSTIEVSGNSLTKISGTSSWYDAGAVSTQTIAAGDGYVEFTPGSTTTWRMCGLGNGDTGAYFADIDYALFIGGSGDLHIYESGNYRGYFGTYAASDRLRVAVEGGVVKYYRNGVLLYTSTVAPQYPLLVDTSLNTVWSYFSNVVISTVPAPNPVRYVLQDIQGSTRAVMSGAQIVARHDYLPFGEEIGALTGMRTTAQGFGAADKIRQHYGLTERDDSSGLDHTWWRKYESFAGRWTSPDPYRGSMTIANPQSLNRYAYVQNDPVNFVDPTGLNLAAPGGITIGSGYCFYVSWVEDGRSTFVGGHCMADPGSGSGSGGDSGGGEPPQEPRPSPHPSPVANPQQKGFDDCATAANRQYRWRYLQTSGMAMAGGATIGFSWHIAVAGIPGTAGAVGLQAFFRTAATGAVHHAAHEGALGVQAGLSVFGPGALLASHAVKEGGLNSDRRRAAIESCKKQYPNANHSNSSLNF